MREGTVGVILFKEMISTNYWNSPFCFWDTSEGPMVLELDYSHTLGTDLWWINSWIPKINKIRQIAQALARRKSVHPHSRHFSNHFFSYSGVQKNCMSAKISKSVFLRSETFSYTQCIQKSKMECNFLSTSVELSSRERRWRCHLVASLWQSHAHC
jgi:hypothetical protein